MGELYVSKFIEEKGYNFTVQLLTGLKLSVLSLFSGQKKK